MTLSGRRNWIELMWSYGNRGKFDFLREAKIKVPVSDSSITKKWEKNRNFASSRDLVFVKGRRKVTFDSPHREVDKIKIHRRNVFIGGEHSNKKHVKKVLESNFTQEELKAIKNLYIEAQPDLPAKVAGRHEWFMRRGKRIGSIVSIRPSYHESESCLTHEVVHALRAATGRWVSDRNKDEKMTDLETLARISSVRAMDTGYYWYLDNAHKAKTKDKTALGRLRGKRAIRKVQEYYPKSEIREAHFSPAEYLDRYFLIVRRDGVSIRVHLRFKRNYRATLEKLRKHFRKRYGRGIKVWEYRNGKKYKVI